MSQPIQYISTRGQTEPMGFQDAVMTGLAPDGGLLIPDRIPDVSDKLADWASQPYPALAMEVLRLFVDIPEADLERLITESYQVFRDPQIAPTVPVGPMHVLELFHGPTLAFKDIALQFLSRFFEYTLEQRDQHMNILGATSGDTGSAAIHGVRGMERIKIFMMHPRGRVAPLQERQMTTVLDSNVFNLAVDGTFDDCQHIMKDAFRDLPFKDTYALGAVNSVNWARVLAQVVYYFYSGFRVMEETGAKTVSFSVPTGNFGDILAGWYAKQMGLPISRLVLATNENDILARFFRTGTYSRGEVVKTISPSMDIQVASNFERYLYYRVGQDGSALRTLMEGFATTQSLSVTADAHHRVDPLFAAGVGTRDQTLEIIRRYYKDYDYLMDPHTAVGTCVAETQIEDGVPMICLATAHPAKFSDAIRDAIGEAAHHEVLDGLLEAPVRCESLPNDRAAVCDFIAAHS